jgi:hypothetical protein
MNIKNLLYVLAMIFSFAFTSIAQENYATAKSADKFITANKEGVFHFLLPESVTAEDVALSAEFYTMYFKVNFDEGTHLVTITMEENGDKAKHVMVRFLVSLGLREVMYDNKLYEVEKFYQTFLRIDGIEK